MKLMFFLFRIRHLLGLVAVNQIFSKMMNYGVLPKIYSTYGHGKIFIIHILIYAIFDVILILLTLGFGRSLGLFMPNTLRPDSRDGSCKTAPEGEDTTPSSIPERLIRWVMRKISPHPKFAFLFVSTQFGALITLVYFRYIKRCDSQVRLAVIFTSALVASSFWSTFLARLISPYWDQVYAFVRRLLAF